ncbi:hypothetical protein [Nocardia sp. NPDC047038]|uniref:hypothetical protein n=1 Tax=Nocardia sp. NPDC047038 TaxID=3154338 RepID=UPI0033E62062
MNDSLVSASPAGGAREQLPVPGVCDIPLGPQQVCDQVGEVATQAVGSAWEDMVDFLMSGFGRGVRFVMAWWTDLPSPVLTGPGGQPGAALTAVRDFSGGLQVVFLTAGIMFAAARLALAKRGGLAGEAQESFLMLVRASFTSMAFAVLVTTGTRAGDAFSEWVISTSSHGDWMRAVDRLTEFDKETNAGLGTGILFVVGLLGLISTLIQLVMLVIRQALLILVVAVIPLAAAASGTGPGSQSYKKLLSWSLAFVLYKPVGALVYAIAFTVMGDEKQTDPQQVLLGLILLVMSVIVLPALVRLVAPAVSTLGGGGGATAVLAGGAAGVAMGSTGDRGSARKVSEGENAPSSSGSGDASGGGGGGGGGGRPLGGGSGSDSGTASEASAGTGGSSGSGAGSTARSTPPNANPSSGAGAESGGAAGGGGAAAGAGAAGAAVMAAQQIKAAGEQGVAAVESQTRDAADGGWNPDSLTPAEVRR